MDDCMNGRAVQIQLGVCRSNRGVGRAAGHGQSVACPSECRMCAHWHACRCAQVCGDVGNPACANQVFGCMLQLHVAPNSLTYAAFIDACVHGKEARRALQVLHEMVSGGWTVDVTSRDAVLVTCAQQYEPFATIRATLPHVEMGDPPICTGAVYERLCEIIEQVRALYELRGFSVGTACVHARLARGPVTAPKLSPPCALTHCSRVSTRSNGCPLFVAHTRAHVASNAAGGGVASGCRFERHRGHLPPPPPVTLLFGRLCRVESHPAADRAAAGVPQAPPEAVGGAPPNPSPSPSLLLMLRKRQTAARALDYPPPPRPPYRHPIPVLDRLRVCDASNNVPFPCFALHTGGRTAARCKHERRAPRLVITSSAFQRCSDHLCSINRSFPADGRQHSKFNSSSVDQQVWRRAYHSALQAERVCRPYWYHIGTASTPQPQEPTQHAKNQRAVDRRATQSRFRHRSSALALRRHHVIT